MIEVRAYQPGDLDRIAVQPGQAGEDAIFHPATPEAGPCFTIERDGVPVFVGGLAEGAPHYASAWAVFASGLGGDYAAIVRAIARVLDACRFPRVDVLVRDDWGRAHALARLLGFEREGVMQCIGAEGEDFACYARVRPELFKGISA